MSYQFITNLQQLLEKTHFEGIGPARHKRAVLKLRHFHMKIMLDAGMKHGSSTQFAFYTAHLKGQEGLDGSANDV